MFTKLEYFVQHSVKCQDCFISIYRIMKSINSSTDLTTLMHSKVNNLWNVLTSAKANSAKLYGPAKL